MSNLLQIGFINDKDTVQSELFVKFIKTYELTEK
jgi:hypothetical protein